MKNKSQIDAPNTQVIGTEMDQEFDHWTNKFGITKEEILKVIKAGGTAAQAVENYVNKLVLRMNAEYAL